MGNKNQTKQIIDQSCTNLYKDESNNNKHKWRKKMNAWYSKYEYQANSTTKLNCNKNIQIRIKP